MGKFVTWHIIIFRSLWFMGFLRCCKYTIVFKAEVKLSFSTKLVCRTRYLCYREISTSIDFKVYLNVVNIPKHRIALSRVRTSSHHLAIETGRWHKPISIPYNDWKCIVCDELDDDVVIEYTPLSALRKLYTDKYYWKRPCMFKCIALITSENETLIRKLSNFAYKAFLRQ